MKTRRIPDQIALAAVAALYAATWAGVGVVAMFAWGAWQLAGPTTRIESVALLVAIAATGALAHGGRFLPEALRAWQRPAGQAFRYIIWLPILISGPAGLALLGIWWSIVSLGMVPGGALGQAAQVGGLPIESGRHPRLRELVAAADRAAGPGLEAAAPVVHLNLGADLSFSRRGPRTVGLGLYALALLTPEELGAVLTREFALRRRGSLAWRLHQRFQRRLGMRDKLDLGTYLFFPRLAIGRALTRGAARAWEGQADALAAQTCGEERLAQAKRRLAELGRIQSEYHQNALAPVLMLGHRPGLVEGLRHWLEGSGHGTAPPEADVALALVEAPWVVEDQLVQRLGIRLKPVAWEGVARELYLSNWEQVLSDHGESLRGWTPRLYPELCRDLDAVGRRLLKADAGEYPPAQRMRVAETVLGISLAMCVKRAGWNVYDLPGQPLWLEGRTQRLEPFELVRGLRQGKTTPEAFLDCCGRAGILDCDLSGERQ